MQVPIRLCSKGIVVDCSLSTGYKYIVMIYENICYNFVRAQQETTFILLYFIRYSISYNSQYYYIVVFVVIFSFRTTRLEWIESSPLNRRSSDVVYDDMNSDVIYCILYNRQYCPGNFFFSNNTKYDKTTEMIL